MHRAGRSIPITGKWCVEIGEIPRRNLLLSVVFGFVDEFGTSVKICQIMVGGSDDVISTQEHRATLRACLEKTMHTSGKHLLSLHTRTDFNAISHINVILSSFFDV
jgi:hypothetical protein